MNKNQSDKELYVIHTSKKFFLNIFLILLSSIIAILVIMIFAITQKHQIYVPFIAMILLMDILFALKFLSIITSKTNGMIIKTDGIVCQLHPYTPQKFYPFENLKNIFPDSKYPQKVLILDYGTKKGIIFFSLYKEPQEQILTQIISAWEQYKQYKKQQ